MVDVSSQNNSVSINVSSGGNSASIKATPDMAQYYSEKSREWAISNRIVDGVDYSSKYYAEKSKESEAKAENYERSVIEKYNSFVEVSNQAETELQTLRDDSISQINTVASSGISDIANKTSEAVTEINSNKETATNEINNAKNSAVTQLSKEAQEQLKNIESTGFYMRDDKLYFINSEGEEEEFKSGGAGAVMFDTKIADHILQGEEALGWALQGTYVNKTDYPDFYNKCLEEYQDSTINDTEPWTQPVATSDTTPIRGGEMVFTASSISGGWNAYLAFDGIGEAAAKGWASNGTNIAGWWQVKFPYKIRVTGLKYYRRYSVGNDNAVVGRFYTSSEKSVAIGNEFSVPAKASEQYSLDIASIPSDGIVTDTIYLECQAVAGSYAGMDYLQIKAEKVTGIEIRQNPNGHKFYPISQKHVIDEIYNQYGIADFYGIDEENERVFLPRNKYFHQLTVDVSKVNEMIEAGLPNIEGAFRNHGGGDLTATGPFYVVSDGAGWVHAGTDGKSAIFGFNASRSNPIYGNSDTVQPPSSLKLLYYCVGNTEVTQAITNITEITTSENDTIPLFTGMYFDFKPNNVSWLKAGVQQNSAGIYKACYETLVEIVNGVNNYDLKVINQEDMVSGVIYDEYWILDQDNLTFRTPLTIATKSLSGGVAGNGMAMGVTDGTHLASLYQASYLSTIVTGYGATVPSKTTAVTDPIPVDATVGLTKDSSKSGIIAEQSTARLYFKVANAVQNLELLDAGEVLEGLANKLDRANKEEIISWGMPDYDSGVSVELNTDIVAPYPCFVTVEAEANASGLAAIHLSVKVNNQYLPVGVSYSSVSGYSSSAVVGGFFAKGQTFRCIKSSGNTFSAVMYPLKGVN